ncbi:TIGR03643 family protein [Prochlorococcus sp. AH-716-M10]|nr:TIGR03643 family protein [Prochlorococcus sp. AH-716-M10]
MEIIDIDRLIEMCWEDRTPFEAIEYQFGLKEEDAIKIMRSNLKPKSFKVWRKRVSGRKTKHMELKDSTRFKSTHKRKL